MSLSATSSASSQDSCIASISEIIQEMREGRMVILVDEEDRENEGDLVMAAQFVTPDAINFMAKHGRGLICLTLTKERCDFLGLPPMAQQNGTAYGTNFTVSIEAKEGVTTGISAADRARTIQVAVHPHTQPTDLVQPGHIFPLAAVKGGVLVRAGHTEAGCDLTALAGLTPAAVICEILNEDGSMARLPDLQQFAQQHQLKIGTIADLIEYRSQTESMVTRIAQRPLETAVGTFQAYLYQDTPSGSMHLALVHGTPHPDALTHVRVHEPTSVLDVLEKNITEHSWSVMQALKTLQQQSAGVLILLNCDSSSAEIHTQFLTRAEIHAEPTPKSARPKGLRTYGIGAQILKDLQVGRMNILAEPRNMPNMAGFALTIEGYTTPSSSSL